MTPDTVYHWLSSAIAESEALNLNSLFTPEQGVPVLEDIQWGSPPQPDRPLATVRQIKTVTALNDDHHILTFEGWRVVVRKDRGFTPRECVLFLEPDSFLPAGRDTKSDFLFSQVGPLTEFDHQPGYRVGTSIWLDQAGNEVNSEGYVFHLSDFPNIDTTVRCLDYYLRKQSMEIFHTEARRFDFSSELGIKKWESFPEEMPADDKVEVPDWTTGPMSRIATEHTRTPPFIPKTDTKRVQECPNLFVKPKYTRQIYQQSTKMDGSTISVYFLRNPINANKIRHIAYLPSPDAVHNPTAKYFINFAMQPTGRFGVCSRNKDILPHLLPCAAAPQYTTYWKAAVAAMLPEALRLADRNLVVQGELVGATVQGNPYGYPDEDNGDGTGRPSHEMFVFSISEVFFEHDCNGRSKIRTQRWDPRRVQAFAEKYSLKHVPVLGYAPVTKVAKCHDDLRDMADESDGEGFVFKNCKDGRWFKVLSTTWLMEKGDEMHARKQLEARGGDKWKGKDKAVADTEPTEPEPELEQVEVAEPEREQVEVPEQEEVPEQVEVPEQEEVPEQVEMVERKRMRIGDWEPDTEDEAKIIKAFKATEEWIKNMTLDQLRELMERVKLEGASHGSVAHRGSDPEEESAPVETLSLEAYSAPDEALVPVETLSLEVDEGVVDSTGADGEDSFEELWGGGGGAVDPTEAEGEQSPEELRGGGDGVGDSIWAGGGNALEALWGGGSGVVAWLGAEGWGLDDTGEVDWEVV